MKKLVLALVFVLASVSLISCAKKPSTPLGVEPAKQAGSEISIELTEYKNKDFSFKYPASWVITENGGEIDQFGGIGVVAANSFGDGNYWLKDIKRSDLVHAGGGLVVNQLPKDGAYLFVMDTGATGENLKSARSELNASAKPYGNPSIFQESSLRIINSLDTFPKKDREKIEKKWTVDNEWLHYRAEFTNHGRTFDAHLYLLGRAATDKSATKVAELIMKSFKLVDPSKNK